MWWGIRPAHSAAARLALHLGRVARGDATAGFTVIAPDLRGLGDSAKPATGYAKSTVARDVHELVEHLGHPTICLVGMDIGTMVAYAYAAAYPA
jgi:pimeloyl-ACP methyl ester carboxylesterase